MSFENYFPLWNNLNTAHKKLISDNLITQHVKKGTIIHNGNMDCTGLLLVKSGQLRTYILSDEGREITLYRLFNMDMCLLSASCIIRSIQFEVTIEAEKDERLRGGRGTAPSACQHRLRADADLQDRYELHR